MVALKPWRVPSSSSILEGGEPARTVVVKKSVKGLLRGAGTALLADQPVEILSLKEALEGV